VRPAVDVVIPFRGSDAELDAVLARAARIVLRADDTLTVVDNRPGAASRPGVLAAPALASSYHARNRGAAAGGAPWIVFIDTDVDPAPDLLDRYFDPEPAERTAVLAGGIVDSAGSSAAERYAELKRSMSHESVSGFAQTANCAVRRAAFEQLGGFREVRSGGDADLCFRLGAERLEQRPQARVVHLNRTTLPAMLRQRARHGSGAAWLERTHPGSFPRRRWPGLALWSTRRMIDGLASLARGDRDAALLGLLDGPTVWAFELGRLFGNQPRR
jgi:hypothetical protein